MANIKPAEVSKILRQQLEGIQTGVELEEVPRDVHPEVELPDGQVTLPG